MVEILALEAAHLVEKPGKALRGELVSRKDSEPDILGKAQKQENQQELSWSGRSPAIDREKMAGNRHISCQPLVRLPRRLETNMTPEQWG